MTQAMFPPSLQALAETCADCQACRLADTRTHTAFGVGPAPAPLLVIGEAPGRHEDQDGEPFTGPAGELLDRMLAAIGQSRKVAHLTNIVKCRPKGRGEHQNRSPFPDEIRMCTVRFLLPQIQAVRPRVILALGTTASRFFCSETITKARGKTWTWEDIPVRPTWHPAYLVRTTGNARIKAKQQAWEDLQAVQALLVASEPIPGAA